METISSQRNPGSEHHFLVGDSLTRVNKTLVMTAAYRLDSKGKRKIWLG